MTVGRDEFERAALAPPDEPADFLAREGIDEAAFRTYLERMAALFRLAADRRDIERSVKVAVGMAFERGWKMAKEHAPR